MVLVAKTSWRLLWSNACAITTAQGHDTVVASPWMKLIHNWTLLIFVNTFLYMQDAGLSSLCSIYHCQKSRVLQHPEHDRTIHAWCLSDFEQSLCFCRTICHRTLWLLIKHLSITFVSAAASSTLYHLLQLEKVLRRDGGVLSQTEMQYTMPVIAVRYHQKFKYVGKYNFTCKKDNYICILDSFIHMEISILECTLQYKCLDSGLVASMAVCHWSYQVIVCHWQTITWKSK